MRVHAARAGCVVSAERAQPRPVPGSSGSARRRRAAHGAVDAVLARRRHRAPAHRGRDRRHHPRSATNPGHTRAGSRPRRGVRTRGGVRAPGPQGRLPGRGPEGAEARYPPGPHDPIFFDPDAGRTSPTPRERSASRRQPGYAPPPTYPTTGDGAAPDSPARPSSWPWPPIRRRRGTGSGRPWPMGCPPPSCWLRWPPSTNTRRLHSPNNGSSPGKRRRARQGLGSQQRRAGHHPVRSRPTQPPPRHTQQRHDSRLSGARRIHVQKWLHHRTRSFQPRVQLVSGHAMTMVACRPDGLGHVRRR